MNSASGDRSQALHIGTGPLAQNSGGGAWTITTAPLLIPGSLALPVAPLVITALSRLKGLPLVA